MRSMQQGDCEMKKIFSCFLIAATIVFTGLFAGCSAQTIKNTDSLSIVTTSFPPYDFARAVTSDSAEITMLLCPGAEAHSYEPAPLDILKIQQCDVFIYIGGEGEVWVDKILSSVDTENMTIIKLFDFVDPLEEEDVVGASPNGHNHDHDHDEDEHHDTHSETESDHDNEEYDEHIWTSPQNAIKCVEGINEAICKSQAENSAEYKKNSADYISKLKELDKDFAEMAENAPENVIVIGDRFPFRYLTSDYGLEYFAAFSGCSSESEPGVYTMAFLIDEILEHGIDKVFYLEFSTKRLAEKLCDATDAETLSLHSCHNVSKADFENGVTYIELMRQNLNNLREALY